MNQFSSIRLVLTGIALLSMTSLVAADGPRNHAAGRKSSMNRTTTLQQHSRPSSFSWAESSSGQSKLKSNPARTRTETVDKDETITFRKRIDKSSPVKGAVPSEPTSPAGLKAPTGAKSPSGIIAILIGL